jgi:ATP-dependent DNA helicase RecQ
MLSEQRHYALALLHSALGSGTADFREGQWEAVDLLVNQSARLLVVQRTGWGKSLVYFLATRLLRDHGRGATLLISPLLALMRNQLQAAERMGVRAASLNSANTEEWDDIVAQIQADQIDLLLISPERLANERFRRDVLSPMADRIGMLVVDEAHCISDWGHDFRPDYRRIVRILQALPSNIPVLATTATANNRVVADIRAQLGETLRVSRGALVRESLQLQTIHLPNQAVRLAWLAANLPRMGGSGIIYTLTTRDADRVATWLQNKGLSAYAYHAGIESERRIALEEDLLANRIQALVATSALGMGFDKPDLGFVIHFQRPGSVVHYYQQVGRAGRALPNAFGILLSGTEDKEITDYFIRTAFPPMVYTEAVLALLNVAEKGLSTNDLQRELNIPKKHLDKVLQLLGLESPAPVIKQDSKWYATAIKYVNDKERIEQLTAIRHAEQRQMQSYLNSTKCLMQFLAEALDDPTAQPCGRCAVCRGELLFAPDVEEELIREAGIFLRRNEQPIQPRRNVPKGAFPIYGWQGTIPIELRAETGRALGIWGDAGWGYIIKADKQIHGKFRPILVDGAAKMIRERWNPDPFPTWVTCVPSLTHPTLIPDYAERLAASLGIPFIPVVHKSPMVEPQKRMQNSFQQARNLDGVFTIKSWSGIRGAVLLVDDMVDSRWTITVIAALLRQAGSGPVFPFALALVQSEDL